jgi:hypothetical protein
MAYDIRDDIPEPNEQGATAETAEAIKQPDFNVSKKVPIANFADCPYGFRSAIAEREATGRGEAVKEIMDKFLERPKGYEIIPMRGQLVVASLHETTMNRKEQTVHPLKGESGIISAEGRKIVRAFGFFAGNQVVHSVSDLQGEHVVLLVRDEDDQTGEAWFKKDSTSPTAKLDIVRYTDLGVRLDGLYHFDAAGRRTFVGWNDTVMTEDCDPERQKTWNTRFIWSQTRYEESGAKRIVGVHLGPRARVEDQLLAIQYKQSRNGSADASSSLTEQIEQIRFDDGTKLTAQKNGFALRKDVNGRSQYIGTIAEPNFALDKLGNLSYTECLFDDRKGETCAAADAPIYRVTKLLDRREIRKRIR